MNRTTLVLGLCVLCMPAAAQDWPRFLGPNLDGTLSQSAFAREWTDGGLREAWSAEVGTAYSGLAVDGGRVYSMDMRQGQEFVFALDADSGREVWRVRLGPSPRNVYGGLGPRVTPTAFQGALYLVSAQGDLLALDTSDGEIVWRKPLKEPFNARFSVEGYSSAVLAEDDRLYAVIGGRTGLAAFDRSTGQVVWTAQLNERASYSSPVFWKVEGKRQLLYLSSASLFGLDPADGRVLWRYPWETYDGVNVATPVPTAAGRLLISAGYNQGAAVLAITRSSDGWNTAEVWRNDQLDNHFNNSVVHNGFIYGYDDFILKCLDAATGREMWKTRGYGKGSILLVGDRLLLLSEQGRLTLAEPSPDSLRVLHTHDALSGRCWTPPSPSGSRVYLRNQSRVICLEPNPDSDQ